MARESWYAFLPSPPFFFPTKRPWLKMLRPLALHSFFQVSQFHGLVLFFFSLEERESLFFLFLLLRTHTAFFPPPPSPLWNAAFKEREIDSYSLFPHANEGRNHFFSPPLVSGSALFTSKGKRRGITCSRFPPFFFFVVIYSFFFFPLPFLYSTPKRK